MRAVPHGTPGEPSREGPGRSAGGWPVPQCGGAAVRRAGLRPRTDGCGAALTRSRFASSTRCDHSGVAVCGRCGAAPGPSASLRSLPQEVVRTRAHEGVESAISADAAVACTGSARPAKTPAEGAGWAGGGHTGGRPRSRAVAAHPGGGGAAGRRGETPRRPRKRGRAAPGRLRTPPAPGCVTPARSARSRLVRHLTATPSHAASTPLTSGLPALYRSVAALTVAARAAL